MEWKRKLCYMDTDSFIVYIKTGNMYSDTGRDFETRFIISNYEWDRPLTKGKNKKVIGLRKNELRGKTMNEFPVLKVKTFSYLIESNHKDKKCKSTKKFLLENP